MKTTSLLLLVVSTARVSLGQTVTLEQVLHSAVAKASAEDARVEVAQNQLRVLEAQNKWKVELRPSLGMFAFTNPALLALNLGGGLLSGRRGAPSALALKSAQIDVVAAELNAERLKVHTEIGAARDYFDLLAKQQIAASSRGMVESRCQKLREVDSLLKKAKVTMLDKMNVEQEVIDLEQYALDAETQREIAAANLAFLIGFKDAGSLVAKEVTALHPVSTAKLPDVEKLLESAMFYRKEPAILRSRIDALRKQLTPAKGANSKINSTFGRGELGVAITLKDNGEKQREAELIAARLRLLELELSNMETELRKELQEVRFLAAASAGKMQLNTKRLELAERRKKVLSIRAQNGLDGSLAALLASESTLAEERESVSAVYERKASMFALMVLCGIEDQSKEVVANVLSH